MANYDVHGVALWEYASDKSYLSETGGRGSADIVNASNASLFRSVIGDARLAYAGSSARSYLSTAPWQGMERTPCDFERDPIYGSVQIFSKSTIATKRP